MQKHTVDVAVIGAGTAGLSARRAAENAGATTVLIDGGPLGTTCARVGCMPAKLLIAAADAAHHGREAGVFGVQTQVDVDGKAVMNRVRQERDRFVGFVLKSVGELRDRGRLLEGYARFVDGKTLMVGDDHRVEASRVVIATGSTPFLPPPFRNLDPALLIDTDQIFELEDLPESLLVVGSGVIGLELGQAFHRLGVRVSVVGTGGRVGPLSDPKLVAEARTIFTSEFDFHPDYELEEIKPIEKGGEKGVEAAFVSNSNLERAQFEKVLLAAGRRPNLAQLGLDSLGLQLSNQGIPLFDPHTMQIADTPYFIAGDVNNDRPLLHEAADEGRLAGTNAARYPQVLVGQRRTPLGIVFTDPQIAVVGESFSSMNCSDNRVGEVDYGDQGRARVMNQHRGRVRIYGEAGTGLLLGAEMVGPRVEHTAHLLAWAIQQKLTVSEALEMPFYHPVIEEGIRTALRNLQSNLRLSRPIGQPCEEFGPGD
jgi:dihydrolipoamide dehydrogenase